MNIVFIIDQVYMHGGIERVLSIKANYLSRIKGYTIHILTTEQQGKAPCYDFDSKINFEDLNINYIRNKSYFHPKNLLKLPHHITTLKKRLKDIAPDVVVVCSHSADTYFIPFIKTKIPKIKEFHYSKFIEIDKRKKPTSLFKTLFFKFADYVETKYNKLVALNPDEAAYFKSNNVVVIPNPLTFYPETISNVNENVVISAGRIASVKRFDILIDIWELVHSKNKDWQLHIYGTGEQKYIDELEQKIKNKKLSNHLFLKGTTNHIQNKMLHSSLFVMTSDNECFPLVLLEAQACGLPIISFDCPNGPRNIINNKNGRLIKMKDLNHFSETILELSSNSSLRKKLGEDARLNSGKYNIEKVMGKWIGLFEELNKQVS
jgi:glycosyltransferase involved in cell wall biosynthesis